MWNFEIITDWKTIESDDFQNYWSNLVAISPTSHVFFHPVVANVWIDTYRSIRKLSPLFVIAKSDSNEAFLPLFLWRKNWKNAFVKSIIPLGYSDYDYHNPLFKKSVSDSELNLFWSELLTVFGKYNIDEICIDGITDSLISRSTEWAQNEICPSLYLSKIKCESDLMSLFGTKLRGDIRRQIRRLNEIAPLQFKEYDSSEILSDNEIERFLDTHSTKWPKAYKAPNFHNNLIRFRGLNGPIHYSTLYVGDEIISWHLGFEFNGIYYYYMPVGNPKFSNFSPVKIHLYYLICRAIEKGYTKFDHLRGDETYKQGWANDSQFVNSFHWKNESILSKMKIGVVNIKKKLTK